MSPQDLRIAVHFLCGFGFVRLLYPDGDEVDVAFPQRRPRGFDDLAIHAVALCLCGVRSEERCRSQHG
jgi:hypothetical protein